MRPKDPIEPRKQDGVVCKILCDCGKVYWPNRKVRARSTIGIYGFHDLRLRPFLNTQIRPVSYPVWDEVKFIARDPHWYSRRVKEAIHIRLHSDNINRISGIAIPEAWMPTLRQHDNRPLPQRTAAGSVSSPRFVIHQLLTTTVVHTNSSTQ